MQRSYSQDLDLINNGQPSPLAPLAGGDDWRARPGAETSGGQSWGLRSRLTEREIIHLKRLIPVADSDLDDGEFILATLYRALEGERRRGKQGKWSYDINRHTALWRMIKRVRSMRDEQQAA